MISLPGDIPIKSDREARRRPLLCVCRSQTAQQQGKDPSNGAIQNGYIEILRLPRWITITRVATIHRRRSMPGQAEHDEEGETSRGLNLASGGLLLMISPVSDTFK